MTEKNPMREIKIEKVTLNIGVGEPGEELEKSKNLLEKLTEKTAKETQARKRSAFGVSQGRNIGVMVTLRNEEAEEFLEKALEVKDGKIDRENFTDNGNFSLGIEEHIDLPGAEYEPEIGIHGLDIAVTLIRPGYRIKKKKISKPVGKSHKITKEEAMEFVKDKFNVEITGD
ncbi:MAG: 50S ribosomal protein L5 [Candidatus Aenigmatarchaeota archaeon]